MDNVLPERPKSEDVAGENNKKAYDNAIGCALFSGCSSSQSDGNDGLCQVEEEVLGRDPQQQPYHKNDGVGNDCGEERGRAAGALEDVGKGGEGREGGEGGTSLGRDKGEGSEEKLNDGEDGWRELEEDDEDGEHVPQRTGRENGGGDREHGGHGQRSVLGACGVCAAESR